ncbi:hypothetical protein [Stenotrophomonas sp.]|uniref:hypothetical protein n=1 Tax=Stenotrophomonas sp. TaxID=69392 RepID=UPI0028A14291|nr:hypothetical protein [Stenotrophomonas sp.]
MNDYPRMIYRDGDLSGEYRIVADQEELEAAAADGFYPHDQVPPPAADPFLDRTIAQIEPDLEALSADQLDAYRELEAAAVKPRTGLLKAIDDAIAAKQAT